MAEVVRERVAAMGEKGPLAEAQDELGRWATGRCLTKRMVAAACENWPAERGDLGTAEAHKSVVPQGGRRDDC